MKYQVQYENQNWIPSDLEAASPLEAAQLYLAQDSDRRYEDYDKVVVFWGGLEKQTESFLIPNLLAFKNEGDNTRPSLLPGNWALVNEDTRLQVKPPNRSRLSELYTVQSLNQAVECGSVGRDWLVGLANTPDDEITVTVCLVHFPKRFDATRPSTQDRPKLGKPMLLLLAAVLAFGLAYHVRYSGEGMTFQNAKGGGTLTLDATVAFFRGLEDQRFYKTASTDLRNRRVGSGLLVLTGFGCMVQAARCYRKLRATTSPIQLFRS